MSVGKCFLSNGNEGEVGGGTKDIIVLLLLLFIAQSQYRKRINEFSLRKLLSARRE